MKKLLIAVLMFTFFSSAWAQTAQDKAKMERERQAIQQELKEIQSIYSKVKGQKKETIGQVALLQRKMNVQGQYVNNISKEIKILNDDIYLSNLEIRRLQHELDTLKTQYAKSVVYAYKNKSTYDYLNFIFSSSSFNDALKRISYLKSYRSYRQQQVANILETQQKIEDHKQEILGKKTQKSSALQNQTKQLQELEVQKKEKDAVVAKLKSQESELQKQITARKKRDAELKKNIAAVIRREIEAARKKAEEEDRKRRDAERERLAREKKADAANNNTASVATTTTVKKTTAAAKPKSYLDLNEKDVALNADFSKNRGSLPWPVDNGLVSIPFGVYTIPGTRITGDNPGITIGTPSAGASVKSIFDGEVSSVSNLGDGMTVMVRHGKYFTVYSNLSSASVSKGTIIKRGQVIGRSGPADDGSGGQIDFLLMVEDKNVNPEPWLR